MLRIVLGLIFVLRLSSGYLDPAEAPWLVYISFESNHPEMNWPISTFDKTYCSKENSVRKYFETCQFHELFQQIYLEPDSWNWRGCHGVLVNEKVVLTSTACIDIFNRKQRNEIFKKNYAFK